MKKIKRMLSLFLALVLLLGTLPLYALADEPDAVVHTEIGEETISSYSGRTSRSYCGCMSNMDISFLKVSCPSRQVSVR